MFVLPWLASLVLWWHALVATFGLTLRNDAYTRTVLIIPISIALVASERRSQKAQPEPNVRAGMALLALAVLIGLIGYGWWGFCYRPARGASSPWYVDGCHFVDRALVCCFGTRYFSCSPVFRASCDGWFPYLNLRRTTS